MVNTQELTESEFLGTQFVKDSTTKKAVILNSGTVEPSKDGNYKQLQLLVEIDGRQKKWKLNKISLRALQSKYGNNSELYVGKVVTFSTMLLQGGKEAIIGNPQ